MQSKVMGVCGAEGTETDMKHRQQHIEHILRTMHEAECVDDTIGAEQILALFEKDSAAALARWKPTPGRNIGSLGYRANKKSGLGDVEL